MNPPSCSRVAAGATNRWLRLVRLCPIVALLSTTLCATGTTPSTVDLSVEMIAPAPDAIVHELHSIEVRFNRPVAGVEAADLLVGGTPATQVTEPAEGDFVFVFAQPPDGTVTVAWHADAAIVDKTNSAVGFAGGTWSYRLDASMLSAEVGITEFMADNRRTLNDEDGASSDWIELYNAEDVPVELKDWFLTNDPAELAKWRFPEVSIAAKGYLLVFASEKNRTNAAAVLHTNFKLSSQGGFLGLVSPSTNLVSSFGPNYPAQTTDLSYGRVEGEPTLSVYFTRPTPKAQNAESGPGFAPEAEFSRLSGSFLEPFDLILRTGVSNGVIRYTVDGSLPTNSSPVFSAPLSIGVSTQVRSRVFAPGLLPGPVRTEYYVRVAPSLSGVTSDLPIMVLHNFGKSSLVVSGLNYSHVAVFEPVHGVASLANPPSLVARGGLQVRGSSTSGYPKPSYKLEIWDEFNRDRKVPLVGLPAESDWVLYAPNNFDVPLIHNPFIHQLSRDIGTYSSRTRFVEVYQNRTTSSLSSTHYLGIYVLEEKIKIGPSRVDIDELEPENLSPPSVTGGYLLKIDRLDPGDAGVSGGGVTLGLVDPKEKEVRSGQRRPQYNYVRDYFTAFGKALQSTNWRDPAVGYPAFIDVDAWINFHVLEVLSGNVDTLVLSTYLHKPRDGKIAFGPHWDFDRALGSTDGRDANARLWSTGPFFTAAWWNRLFTDKDFWQKWVDRWQALRPTHFSRTNINRLIDELAAQVTQAQPREYQRWKVRPRKANGQAGGTYETEIQWMKNWLSNRIDFIDRQMTQPPALDRAAGPASPGDVVSLALPTGASVYYTTDGSDPRLPQGDISARARLYTQPILIQTNTRIVARARDLTKRQTSVPATASSPWSAPVAATYVIQIPRLLVTEIMFHPSATAADAPYAASDFEYVELLNAGREPLSLAGFRLTNGVTFTFSRSNSPAELLPGQRVLVVKNRAAFAARYPDAGPVAGEFQGGLKNSSDSLRLVGPLEEPVWQVKFSDAWQRAADGTGFSLVLRDEGMANAGLADPSAWRASSLAGGSPGAADPARNAPARVWINEVVSNPSPGDDDAVELYNEELVSADISFWWLSDDSGTPRKYRFPSGTTIPPKGYLVVKAAEFGRGTTGFRFSALGDEACLTSADETGAFTGWVQVLSFGAQMQGQSFGRIPASDGRERFEPASLPSLGSANPPPVYGPLVVSEVRATAHETASFATPGPFVEITTAPDLASAVPLYDPQLPAHTWRIRGDIEYDFPAGLRLSPNQRLVVVGFDPDREPAALAAFRAAYRLERRLWVLGPWRGALVESGGRLTLERPLPAVGVPGSGLTVTPYSLVESVNYASAAPWPENAFYDGRALVRRVPLGHPDDPQSWTSSLATPGDRDSDGDGMPDSWELRHGLNPEASWAADGAEGDADTDGFSNWAEFLFGSSPADPASRPRMEFKGDGVGGIALEFISAPNRGYSLLQRGALNSGSWSILTRLNAGETGGLLRIPIAPTNATRFFLLQSP